MRPYSYWLGARKVTTDKVVAKGVTIESGARFKFLQLGRDSFSTTFK